MTQHTNAALPSLNQLAAPLVEHLVREA